MKIFIGCSANEDIPNVYLDDCKIFLEELLKDNDLVFGACNKGLMGLAYNIALKNNQNIIGIYPKIYEYEATNLSCKKIPTTTVNDRTNKLIENSDALIFLPGGIGTLYELLTSIESKRGKEFDKPIIIYNSCNYYEKFINFIDLMIQEKFVSEEVKKNFCICNNADETLNYINNYHKNIKIDK